jgi:Zn-dependent M28 family amino/carboxypeptidase
MMRKFRYVVIGLLLACGQERAQEQALDAITTAGLAAHIQALAHDSMEGRAPASPGEEKTVRYLEQQFRALGIAPGNGDRYTQDVPLVAVTADPAARLRIDGRRGSRALRYRDDFVAWTKRMVDSVEVSGSDLVFVGYGIVAPEYGWNDYQGLDVRGKTVVMLVNDPGFATQDTALFRGNTMTYYGRWTYKYEEAARQGAEAAFIVHQTAPAAYPWEVVTGSWSGEQFGLEAAEGNMSRVKVEGWLTERAAREVFAGAGLDFDALALEATQRGSRARPLNARASIAIRNTIRRSVSRNVVGLLRGSARPDEYVIYMAHWDHFGRDGAREGDQIFNGAFDNATGTAGLLEVAKAFAALREPPERSVVFLAVTAEEQGLLGSKHYAINPVYPLNRTVAAINMDGLNVDGPMRDITIVGYGNSALDDYLAMAAETQGRRVRPDPEPEKGFYYRSDHFEFAKRGVPALYPDAGIDHVEHGEEWTMQRRADYTANRYHKLSDEYDPGWDLRGAVDDLRLFFLAGYRLATEPAWPNWRPGTEFRATRDAMMGGGS